MLKYQPNSRGALSSRALLQVKPLVDDYVLIFFFYRLSKYSDECTVTQKIDLMMAGKPVPTNYQDEPKMPQAYYRKLLKGFADAVEPTPMLESWIENIIEVWR